MSFLFFILFRGVNTVGMALVAGREAFFGEGGGELTVAPFQPVVLADGVPTKTDAAVDEARGSARGEIGVYGEACCQAGEGHEDGREDGREPRHGV